MLCPRMTIKHHWGGFPGDMHVSRKPGVYFNMVPANEEPELKEEVPQTQNIDHTSLVIRTLQVKCDS